MKTHELIVVVDRSAAALAGTDVYGDVRVTVNPSTLTERQRQALASLDAYRVTLPNGCDEYLPRIGLPGIGSAEDVSALLDSVADRREQAAAEKASQHEEAIARQIEEILALPLTPPDLAVNPYSGVFHHSESALCCQNRTGSFGSWLQNKWAWEYELLPEAERGPVLNDPRVAALLPQIDAEAARLNAEQQTSTAEATARNEAKAAAKEAEKKAAADRRAKQLADWVAEHGSDNQRRRFARSLLPEQEILDGIRDQAFRPLGGFPVYRNINAEEVMREAASQLDDYERESAGVEFRVDLVTECSAELFDALRRIEQTIQADHPQAQCTLRRHVAWVDGRDEEDDPEVVRYGVKVELKVGELTLSREYAAEPWIQPGRCSNAARIESGEPFAEEA